MRALQLFGDRDLRSVDIEPPADPGPGQVQVAIHGVALNHIDVWGWRGMAFAKRALPLIVGAEAAGTIVATGTDVDTLQVGDRVALYGAETCGTCPQCQAGRDNLCENVAGVHGFHLDGFCVERVNMKARLCVRVPDGVALDDATCAPITFGTVQHMLFDNAGLKAGEWILVHAGGSGIGTAAIQMAKAVGATVITTAGTDEKTAKAKTLGADHVINCREDRFESLVRKITAKRGVDVVFEHTGAETWNGSLLSMKPGGRLVTCGSTTGVSATMNLMQLFQRQYRIFGSFGCRIANLGEAMEKMAKDDGVGLSAVIDSALTFDTVDSGLQRMENRQVFGKIIVRL